MIRQYELVELVRNYDPNLNEDALNKAYVFSMKAHGSQKRASGDPYFSHPLEVAGILTKYRLDWQTIITALLHDTVEDTVATIEEIDGLFGGEVAKLVDGVTKLSKIEIKSEESKQAENFQKLLVAMSDDIRVLLVKLADRLHNMRTLHHIRKPEKRQRIALETMEIYAPLAERIGMQAMKEELQELAFAELNVDARNSIVKRLEFLRAEGGNMVEDVCADLQNLLNENGLKAEVTGREKRPYSIWQKMRRKNLTFERLSDIMAFRIVLDNPTECYQALGVVHAAYRMVPGRFKDYLSTPKPNGYQSIHTTVLKPKALRVEIQIRTRHMHDIAEMGVAAHWMYKQKPQVSDTRSYRWMRELLEILEHASTPEEFLEHSKLEMFQDQVFCFTPKGDLISLPYGATAVDFAYAIHTKIGDTCTGCRINGRMRQLNTRLKTGDQVEVMRGKEPQPNPMWEHFLVTGKARAAIRRFVRKQEREQYVRLGREILQRSFRKRGYVLREGEVQDILPQLSNNISRNLETVDDLYDVAGRGDVTGRAVVRLVHGGDEIPLEEVDEVVSLANVRQKRHTEKSKDSAVPIKGLIPGMAMHFAGCCSPLPGDRIVGIVTTGRGVTIHTVDCDQLEQYLEQPERWLDVAWDEEDDINQHLARLDVSMDNAPGALAEVTQVLARSKSNISNINVTHRTEDFFEMRLDIEVQSVKHLTDIIAQLRANKTINSVERTRC